MASNGPSWLASLFSCCVVNKDEIDQNEQLGETQTRLTKTLQRSVEEDKDNSNFQKKFNNAKEGLKEILEPVNNNAKEGLKEILEPIKEVKNEIKDKVSGFVNNLTSYFPEKYIREDEKNKITFTKEGIIELIDKIKALPFNQIFDKEGLTVLTNPQGTFLSETALTSCIKQRLQKSTLSGAPTLQDIFDVIFKPENRIKWDDTLKSTQMVERISSDAVIMRNQSKKILMFSERETIDKRCFFDHDSAKIAFSTSVPDELYEMSPDIVRVQNYFNILILTETETEFIFHTYGQVDPKIPVPAALVQYTIPVKIKEWYVKFTNGLNDYMKTKNSAK